MAIITQITNSLSSSFSSGGVEVVVRTWQQTFRSLSHTSIVVATFSEHDIPIENNREDFHLVKCKTFPNRKWSGINFAAIKLIYRSIRDTDFLLIHFCKDFFTNIAVLFSIMLRKRFFLQTHGMINLDKERRLIKYYLIFVLKQASKIVTLTHNETILFNRHKIYEVIEMNNPFLITSHPELSRSKYFLYIGRFHERKRPEIAIEAMVQISKLYPDYKLNMYGPESKYKEEMKRLVKSHKLESFVNILPPIANSDIGSLLQEAKIFILPSYSEIFPMAMIEAMYFQCPVICGQDNGLYSKIKDFNLVFNADTVAELTQKVFWIIEHDDLVQSTAYESQQWVIKNCDAKNLAKQLLAELGKF